MSQSDGQNPAKTIKKKVSLSGISLHSGKRSTITFLPSKEIGIVFIYKNQKIKAIPENVSNTTRGTSLGKIDVVEHVLSAIAGLGINCLNIKLSSNEPPVMDGSSLIFAKALLSAGIKELKEKIPVLSIKKRLFIKDRNSSIEILPYNGFIIDFTVDFPAVGKQRFVYNGNYLKEIAPARTFGYMEELEKLKKMGLAKGASKKTALALSTKGYINKPRFKDEIVRHKILDLIGDISLAGIQIKGKIIAKKSGHELNAALVKKIRLVRLSSMTLEGKI